MDKLRKGWRIPLRVASLSLSLQAQYFIKYRKILPILDLSIQNEARAREIIAETSKYVLFVYHLCFLTNMEIFSSKKHEHRLQSNSDMRLIRGFDLERRLVWVGWSDRQENPIWGCAATYQTSVGLRLLSYIRRRSSTCMPQDRRRHIRRNAHDIA